LLSFLDNFVVTYQHEEKETDLLAALDDNAAEVRRTTVRPDQLKKLEEDHARLTASLEAAQKGQIESIAEWAALLAAQGPLLARLRQDMEAACAVPQLGGPIDIDRLASEYRVDLKRRGAQFVDGADGLRDTLPQFAKDGERVRADALQALGDAAEPIRAALDKWAEDQQDLEARLRERRLSSKRRVSPFRLGRYEPSRIGCRASGLRWVSSDRRTSRISKPEPSAPRSSQSFTRTATVYTSDGGPPLSLDPPTGRSSEALSRI
jgi:hypothetical protein